MARVALVLGSGGARGYAHIGVIDELTARGHEIVTVSGASMGALVGGLFAAGKLPAFTEWARTLTKRDVVGLLDLSLAGPGIFRADRVLDKVSELLAGARIEDLPVPFTAVATDIDTRTSVWFQEGPLDAAIRASISIPGVFMPIVLNDRLLVDGGVLAPVPIAPTKAVPSSMTVAVSLTGPRVGIAPGGDGPSPRPVWTAKVRELARRVSQSRGSWRDELTGVVGELPDGLRFVDVVNQSLDTMTDLLTRFSLAAYPPDVLIEVPADACDVMDFHRADEVIELGRELAKQALDQTG